MEREFYKKLLQWKGSSLRKPLVLRGARQVGKTYILTEFAKREYEDFIYINFDENPHFASFFTENLDPDRIIKEFNAVWDSIPNQLAKENKKFIFSAIRPSARARDFETSLQWLKSAGLIVKANHISVPKLPLDAYSDKQIFKVFLLDIGLLGTMSKLDPRIILEGDRLFQEFKEALAENFVALELHDKHFDELYYWSSEGIAEVDFVVSSEHHIFPLEVKAGSSTKKKSLAVYGEKFSKEEGAPLILSRASLRNFALDGRLANYPLYAISLFPRFR